jgi:hypothetical protein
MPEASTSASKPCTAEMNDHLRTKAGWLMIAAALFIFGLADHLPETSLVVYKMFFFSLPSA